MSSLIGAVAPTLVVPSLAKAVQDNPIEAAATIITLIIHPEIKPDPTQIVQLIKAGPRIGKTLAMKDLPSAYRRMVETRMILGSAISYFSIKDPWSEQPLVPACTFRDEIGLERALQTLGPRWAARMQVGQVFLQLVESASAPSGRGNGRRLSVMRAIEQVMPRASFYQRKNFIDRVWRPSQSVAHLAGAIWSLEGSTRAHWGRTIAPPHLIFSPALLHEALRRAEQFAAGSETSPLSKKFATTRLLRVSPLSV